MPRESKKRKRSTSPVQHIPRPANPFIIFRSDRLRNYVFDPTEEACGRQKQKDVSRDAATAWRNIDPTLKELYEIQAKIIKEEHAIKYPGWVYKPKFAKRDKEKNTVVDDDGPHTKRAVRTTKPRKVSSVDAEGEEKLVPSQSTRDAASMEMVWDSSWFSGSVSMADPFYSEPLQPLATVSTPSNRTDDVVVTHLAYQSSLTPPPTTSTDPCFSSFALTSDVHTIPSVYNPNPGGRENLRSESNLLDLSTGGLTPTVNSFTREVSTPESDPPSQGLAQNFDLTCDNLIEGHCYNDDWEVSPAFNWGSAPF